MIITLTTIVRQHDGKASRFTQRFITQSAASVFLLGILLAGHPGAALAQSEQVSGNSAAAPAANEIKLSLGSQLTLTDNIGLSATNKSSGWLLNVTPAIHWNHRASHLVTHLDAGVNLYASSQNNLSRNATTFLNGSAQADFLHRTLLIDATAGISQQDRSLFGGLLPAGRPDTNNSQVQTRHYSISPSYRNRLGSEWDYQLRYRVAHSEVSNNALSDTTTQSVSGSVGNAGSTRKVYTVLSASNDYVEQQGLERYQTGKAQILLGWRPNPELDVFISGGEEYNGYLTTQDRSNEIYDAGFSWRPGKRTTLDASVGHRFYGRSHSASLTHSTRRTLWQISHTKAAASTQDRLSLPIGISTSAYLDQLYASQISDPLLRQQAVNDFIALWNLPSVLIAPINVLSSRYSLDETTQLRTSFIGARNVVTLVFYQRESTLLSGVAGSGLDFGTYGQRLEQKGASLDWSHRLDGRSTAGAAYTHTQNRAHETGVETTANTISLNYQHSVSLRTRTGLTLRRYWRDTTGSGTVTENSIVGTLYTEF